jgi:tRNA threonylcarbamoyladenosine biosynthesis protein TsaB
MSRNPDRFVEGAVLGLEATGGLTGAALVRNGRLVAESGVDARAGSAERLLGLVEQILSPHGLAPRNLARIGVSLGPGSFTGVRIGLSAARGLALGAGVPAVGVPSHQVLAWPWRDLAMTIVLLTGLRRGRIFVEAGRWQEDVWVEELPARCVGVEEVAALAAGLREAGRLLFVGESVESVSELSPDLRPLGIRLGDPLSAARRSASVAALAARRDAVELRGDALDSLAPLYLRGADARLPEERGSGAEGSIHGGQA